MADTTQQATAPGLEAKAQRIYEIPYAELSSHLQKATRKRVAQDAAEDMLEALRGLIYLTDQGREGGLILSRADRKPITNGDQDVIDRAFIAADKAIAKAEGRQ